MNGIFSLKILNKVGFFVKALSKNGTVGGQVSKQISTLHNSLPLMSFSSLFARPSYQTGSKPLLCLTKTQTEQARTITKFSLKKGARKSAKPVPHRFFRLRWGIWIRTIAGRHKKIWQKTNRRKNALLSHVFCNHTQSQMLDKMVNRFWRVPKYYIEDPYEPYHSRENFFNTKRKPWRPDGVDYE